MNVRLTETMKKALLALRLEVVPKVADDVQYWVEVEVEKQIRAEREACRQLVLRGQTDAKTRKRLREDLSQMINERGIG